MESLCAMDATSHETRRASVWLPRTLGNYGKRTCAAEKRARQVVGVQHMPLRMLHFSDLQGLPVPGQFFAFSDAYLDSASYLCDSLCTASQAGTYAHGAAVMSLTFHSIELFFKAAILQRAPSEQFSGSSGHDLDHLYRRYANLYPGKDNALDYLPFKRDVPDIEGLDHRLAEELLAAIQQGKKAMPENQIYRYPTDVNGQPWKAILGFEPYSFRQLLKEIKSDFLRIRGQIKRV